MIRWIVALSLFTATQNVDARQFKDQSEIPEGKGILVTHVLKRDDISITMRRFATWFKAIAAGNDTLNSPDSERYVVQVLTPGTYLWQSVRKRNARAFIEGVGSFEIVPGQITYGGDILVMEARSGARFSIDSNISRAEAYMQRKYPLLSANHKLVHHNPESERRTLPTPSANKPPVKPLDFEKPPYAQQYDNRFVTDRKPDAESDLHFAWSRIAAAEVCRVKISTVKSLNALNEIYPRTAIEHEFLGIGLHSSFIKKDKAFCTTARKAELRELIPQLESGTFTRAVSTE